ncbi:MAG: 2,4-diaminopentanoate dehydrogenase [Defluviitaleaceae bacterium]|nr:2,4-diaminopentanoate dehydrogenase [Defluviitaleaceae bacterium]
MRNVKVAIWGFGAMGRGAAAMLLQKKGVEIVGIVNRRSDVGREMHEVLGVKKGDHPEVIITNKVEDVIFEKSCDVVFSGTDSFTKDAFDKIKLVLENKINCVSIAEEMAWPQIQQPELAAQLDKIAKENGVTVLGTGINPGFIMDYLIVALSGVCENVTGITAKRVNDLSPFGAFVMQEQGVGISVEEFEKRKASNSMTGHVGFPESLGMIAEALGVKLDKYEQTQDPIISKTHREHPHAKVEPGTLAGIRQQAFGYVNGEKFISLDHPQQIHPHMENTNTGDYINIKGTPDINISTNPEIPGGIGTFAMAVNMMPHVINAEPGLATMLDLPVPRAILGDFRQFIKKLD